MKKNTCTPPVSNGIGMPKEELTPKPHEIKYYEKLAKKRNAKFFASLNNVSQKV